MSANRRSRKLCTYEGNLALLTVLTLVFMSVLIGVFAYGAANEEWHELRTIMVGAFSGFSGALLTALRASSEEKNRRKTDLPDDGKTDPTLRPTPILEVKDGSEPGK